jgi:hypothetical protein
LKPAQVIHAAGSSQHSENSPDNPIYPAQDYASSWVKQRAATTATGGAGQSDFEGIAEVQDQLNEILACI